MSDIINILVIEDEPSQIQLYNDARIEHNDDGSNTQIEYTRPENYDQVLQLFENKYYDAAIIDLNLSAWGIGMETKGKEIIDLIRKYARYPVYIVSGSIDHEVKQLSEENKFIDSYDRLEIDSNALLLEIQTLHNTGITKVLGTKGLIDEYLTDIFWKHFAQSKDYWIKHPLKTRDALEPIVSRYALTHLYEYLDRTGRDSNIPYDISEMYINPIIKEGIYPGVILENEGNKYLVLSPACDLAQGKCDFLTLVKLTPFFENSALLSKKNAYVKEKVKLDSFKGTEEEHTELLANIDKKKNVVMDTIQTFARNNKGERYYFLPEYLNFQSYLVDFQDITSKPIAQVESLNIIMGVTVHFLKDIQSKFAAYYARQGSPDFNFKEISNSYTEKYLQ